MAYHPNHYRLVKIGFVAVRRRHVRRILQPAILYRGGGFLGSQGRTQIWIPA
nr:hypothetical protein [Coleofasciculus sp. FACHB-1120]